jgi:hypothetical protein
MADAPPRMGGSSETPPTGGAFEGRLLDIPDPAKGRQRKAPPAGHDDGGKHPRWLPLSGYAWAGRPKEPLAWSEPESARSGARRDGIHWIVSAKQAETRAHRVENACGPLAAGKRRVCCLGRSGFFSKSLSAPEAAV